MEPRLPGRETFDLDVRACVSRFQRGAAEDSEATRGHRMTKPTRSTGPPRSIDPRTFAVDRALLHRGGPACGWGNLGDWSEATQYAQACEALATRVGRAATLGAGDAVLEVACGGGDGLALWLERFAVAKVRGVDVHPESVAVARARLEGPAFALRGRVDVGDAVALTTIADASVDAIVSVDAAYHFAPRDRFFAEARRVLRPGGRLALTDLALASTPRGGVENAAVCALARACAVPRENLMTERAYSSQLTAAGFSEPRLERLDQAVLGGFSSFVQRHFRTHGAATLAAGWPKVLVTGWAAGLVQRRGWVHYVLVSACTTSSEGVARSSAARPAS